MPLYEYHCRTCSQDFDKLRSAAHANDVEPCPACYGEQIERKMSVFAVRRASTSESLALTAASSDGCCGGACACGGHEQYA